MKKLFAILMAVCMLAGVCTLPTLAAEDAVVYLKAGGTGDGSTEAKAAGTLLDAMTAAAAKTTDAKVQVVGDVELDMTSHFTSPVHTNKITITGKGTNGRLLVKNNSASSGIWYLKGALAFEHLELNLDTRNLVFNAELNDIYFLEGVNVTVVGEVDLRLYVRAVSKESATSLANDTTKYDGTKFIGDQKMVFLSGKFGDIAGYGQNRINTDLDGNVYILFGGDAVTNNIIIARNDYGTVNNATVIIDGGEITKFFGYTDRSKANMDAGGILGPKGQFRVIVTDKFDPTKSFTVLAAAGIFQGFTGTSIYDANAELIHDGEGIGDYIIKAEAGVYDALLSAYVNTKTFSSALEKINSGTGIEAGSAPYPEIPVQPENPGQTPEDSTKPTDTTKPADKVTDAATKKPVVTDKQTQASTGTGTSAVTSQPQAQEGLNPTLVWIIIGVAAAVAVAVIVIVAVKKK